MREEPQVLVRMGNERGGVGPTLSTSACEVQWLREHVASEGHIPIVERFICLECKTLAAFECPVYL